MDIWYSKTVIWYPLYPSNTITCHTASNCIFNHISLILIDSDWFWLILIVSHFVVGFATISGGKNQKFPHFFLRGPRPQRPRPGRPRLWSAQTWSPARSPARTDRRTCRHTPEMGNDFLGEWRFMRFTILICCIFWSLLIFTVLFCFSLAKSFLSWSWGIVYLYYIFLFALSSSSWWWWWWWWIWMTRKLTEARWDGCILLWFW